MFLYVLHEMVRLAFTLLKNFPLACSYILLATYHNHRNIPECHSLAISDVLKDGQILSNQDLLVGY